MGLVGVSGFGLLVGSGPALKLVGQTSMRTVTDYTFGIIPMFLLMGQFAARSGMSRELFQAANSFLGHVRGGLGLATIVACGGFAAISGSSVATAATFSTIAYPEMRRFGYPQSFATGVIAAGGTLGVMLPPSTVLTVYGLITQQDIGRLFIAGVLPGVLAATMYMTTIAIIGWVRGRGFLPTGPKKQLERAARGPAQRVGDGGVVRVRDRRALWRHVHADRGGGHGRGRCLHHRHRAAPAFAHRHPRGAAGRDADRGRGVHGADRGAAVRLFPHRDGGRRAERMTAFLTDPRPRPLRRGWVLIMLMYLVLGCLMDAMAMIILTVPVIFPVITAMGFDPIWFGIIIVMTVELGLIHPPVGMNVFVIKSVVQDVKFSTIFLGVIPFVITDIIRLAILIVFFLRRSRPSCRRG